MFCLHFENLSDGVFSLSVLEPRAFFVSVNMIWWNMGDRDCEKQPFWKNLTEQLYCEHCNTWMWILNVLLFSVYLKYIFPGGLLVSASCFLIISNISYRTYLLTPCFTWSCEPPAAGFVRFNKFYIFESQQEFLTFFILEPPQEFLLS